MRDYFAELFVPTRFREPARYEQLGEVVAHESSTLPASYAVSIAFNLAYGMLPRGVTEIAFLPPPPSRFLIDCFRVLYMLWSTFSSRLVNVRFECCFLPLVET